MQSRLRSVSVATFAGTFWFLGHALGDAPARAEPAHAPSTASAARPPDHARPEEERLSDEAELARVVGLVDAAKYEECAARLSRLLDPTSPHPLSDPQTIETARLYHATCLIGLGKDSQADAPLLEAIRQKPDMRPPDSLVFPPRVVERFLKLREDYYKKLRGAGQDLIDQAQREAEARQARENAQRAYVEQLERLARQEVVVHQNQRWIALVPFGVGQFQNRNAPLGWTFFGAEVALTGVALASTAVFSNINNQAASIQARGESPDLGVQSRLSDWHLAMTVSTYTLLGVAVVGVVEAQLSFVPEFRYVRDRPLPPAAKKQSKLTLAPEFSYAPGGFRLGLSGRF
jgi:hypothetical protein